MEAVLETADKLIRDKCRGIISAGDVATLVLATLLHDCAMHLSDDGFATLIKSGHEVPGFADKPWSKLWEDFIAESRRFSGRKLMALFGDSDAIKPPPSDPNDLDVHKMTGKDLLLIGEFLRRHHHRLASYFFNGIIAYSRYSSTPIGTGTATGGKGSYAAKSCVSRGMGNAPGH